MTTAIQTWKWVSGDFSPCTLVCICECQLHQTNSRIACKDKSPRAWQPTGLGPELEEGRSLSALQIWKLSLSRGPADHVNHREGTGVPAAGPNPNAVGPQVNTTSRSS
ncbi:hypothetical protein R1flu_007039 [Riccia fluitans]|uniref:Uncharacterized protein n=1 Tax=Riccia fluitans TaxID=41844 RepID=A0ABD1YYK1_9MARC